ncbi:unnamed protein product [Chondrus crispus]|uniref:Uncharacterized protein n=1 Tax=Chondrus crispus TaxID=2769 RepID=R7Q699_CHOCR|nr:unnamed protein product [Chondrus crispus]CDF34057.1 unnamed protein product [Chondrus crispus]|eukprot:XP_005713876.1 unnamed protein product [Chondrus crispus]
MAKTKQTARWSSGGTAPRKQLALKTARLTRHQRDLRDRLLFQLSSRADISLKSQSQALRPSVPITTIYGLKSGTEGSM